MKKHNKQKKLTFEEYIRKLDYFRWQYLRITDNYKKDWEQYNKIINDDFDFNDRVNEISMNIPQLIQHIEYCAKIKSSNKSPEHSSNNIGDKINANANLNRFKNELSFRSEMWYKYGIKLTANPNDTYDKIIKDTGDNKSYIFYSVIEEYSISDKKYHSIKFEDSSYVNLNVNVSLPIEFLVKDFRKYISNKRNHYFKDNKSNAFSKKWSLPKNVNFEVLEKALEVYLMHKDTNQYGIAITLIAEESNKATETIHELIRSEEDLEKLAMMEKLVDRNEYKVDYYLRKARKTIRNVQEGLFP